jgi:hypothetical protein
MLHILTKFQGKIRSSARKIAVKLGTQKRNASGSLPVKVTKVYKRMENKYSTDLKHY